MKPRSIEDERLREVFGSPDTRTVAGDDCPGDEAIWDACLGNAAPARVAEMLDHSVNCPACQESWRLAREMASSLADPETAPTSIVKRRSYRRLFVGSGVAAAAVIALLVFTPTGQDSEVAPADRFREGGTVSIASRLVEQTPLPRDEFVLRWTGAPEGTVYTLEIAREDLVPVARFVELESEEFEVPVANLADLAPGTHLMWRVDALLPDTTRVSSPVFRATVK